MRTRRRKPLETQARAAFGLARSDSRGTAATAGRKQTEAQRGPWPSQQTGAAEIEPKQAWFCGSWARPLPLGYQRGQIELPGGYEMAGAGPRACPNRWQGGEMAPV